LTKKVISQIKFEIEEINILLATYSDLLYRCQNDTPSLIEQTALSAILHSFYNGLENIWLSIAKRIDHNVPEESDWHKNLLRQMTIENRYRESVISVETEQKLSEYLVFRHFFRHSYSFHLEWEKLESLVTQLQNIWKSTNNELEAFIDTLYED
jgi:hypothetical protein